MDKYIINTVVDSRMFLYSLTHTNVYFNSLLFALIFSFAQVRRWGDNALYVAIHFAGAYFISMAVAAVNPITSSEYGTWAADRHHNHLLLQWKIPKAS